MKLRPVPPTILRVVLCALAFLASACPKPRPALGPGLRQADQLLTEGKPAEALIAYEKAKDEPPPGHALRGIGLSHEALGDRAAALAALTQAMAALPDDAVIRLGLSRLYAASGKREQARAEATYVFQHHPDNLTALIMLGALAENPTQVQEAIDRLEGWRNDPTQRRTVVVELSVALWDLWSRKGERDKAEQVWASAKGAALGNVDASVMMSGVYVGLGRLETAERLLLAVTKAHPQRLDAQRRLAFLASDLDHHAVAQRALATFESDPKKPGETILRARVAVTLGQAATVLNELRDRIAHDAVASREHQAQLRYWLGKALTQTGDRAGATDIFLDAIKVWPDMIPAHLALAESRIAQGALTEAIAGLDTAIASHPDVADLYGVLGGAWMTQGDYAKAEAAFRKRAELTPKDAAGAHLIGVALKAQNKNDDAIAQFEKALALDPAFVDALQALSSIWLATGRAADAEALHQRAVSAAPTRIDTWIAFTDFYLQSGNTTRASAVIQQALKIAPDHVGALGQAAQIAVQVGHYTEAETLLTRMLAVQPNTITALNNLAVLYDEQLNQADKALATAQRANVLAPQNPHVQDTLGWILHRRGKHSEAIALLGPSANVLKDSAVVQFHYGMALIAAGDTTTGKAQLRKALAINPNFAGAREAREAL